MEEERRQFKGFGTYGLGVLTKDLTIGIRINVQNKIWPEFQYCIVDPDVENKAAIQCYERLTFKEHVLINPVDAMKRPVKLILMLLTR